MKPIFSTTAAVAALVFGTAAVAQDYHNPYHGGYGGGGHDGGEYHHPYGGDNGGLDFGAYGNVSVGWESSAAGLARGYGDVTETFSLSEDVNSVRTRFGLTSNDCGDDCVPEGSGNYVAFEGDFFQRTENGALTISEGDGPQEANSIVGSAGKKKWKGVAGFTKR